MTWFADIIKYWVTGQQISLIIADVSKCITIVPLFADMNKPITDITIFLGSI